MKKIFFIPKLTILFLFFSIFLFISCGKDKTIEKIIYGDTIDSEKQFKSRAISREFNNVNEFRDYMVECLNNKTNVLGFKFKIKGTFQLKNTLSFKSKHYYQYKGYAWGSQVYPKLDFEIGFVNTDLDSTISSVDELVFIVRECTYNYDGYGYIYIDGYSYL